MCPPGNVPSVIELNEYSTDEAVFKSLTLLKSGCSLPSNVLSDMDPYQFTPSNLPAHMWYFWSGSKAETENGFWRSTGEACEIYSSLIVGFRKTLQFYEGLPSDGQKTNLMMQEYTTTDKYSSNLDSRGLYRVFLIDGESSGSARLSKRELVVKKLDDVAGPSTRVDQSPDQPPAMGNRSPDQPPAMGNRSPDQPPALGNWSPDQPPAVSNQSLDQPSAVADQSSDRSLGDYVSRGDYLELDDLAFPLSRTTSADSSCMTRSITSEDLFDSDALLCELGDDNGDLDSRKKLNLFAPANLKEVVVQPATLGSPDKESKYCAGQTSQTNPTPESKPGNHCNNNTSYEADTSSSSSSSSQGSSKEDRKERVHRTKKQKIMKYFCFLPS